MEPLRVFDGLPIRFQDNFVSQRRPVEVRTFEFIFSSKPLAIPVAGESENLMPFALL